MHTQRRGIQFVYIMYKIIMMWHYKLIKFFASLFHYQKIMAATLANSETLSEETLPFIPHQNFPKNKQKISFEDKQNTFP